MNRLGDYAGIFDGVEPFSGDVPSGYSVDFMGILTDARFRAFEKLDPASVGGHHVSTELPRGPGVGDVLGNGEDWFERVNWFAAAREARDRFVMMTLGANWGAQAVGAARALQLVNPMPYKLVAVEPIPENMAWVAQHMRDNGIDPEQHWLVEMAISDRNAPVLFPVGAPGLGAQNCLSTNDGAMRVAYAEELIGAGRAEQALRSLLRDNTTGLNKKIVQHLDVTAEVKLVSAVTLRDLLGPFERVDYLESDVQQSEIVVFPPYLDLLKRKVRCIHLGTHGRDVHWALHDLFRHQGWEIVFCYEPNATHQSDLGPFTMNDGVLTVRNPEL
jgi:hypothetical protein